MVKYLLALLLPLVTCWWDVGHMLTYPGHAVTLFEVGQHSPRRISHLAEHPVSRHAHNRHGLQILDNPRSMLPSDNIEGPQPTPFLF